MAEQPVNLATALYLGVFSRAEQRVLLATKIAISAGNSAHGRGLFDPYQIGGRFCDRRLMREIYSRDEIISRWVLTVISPQPIGSVSNLMARFLDPSGLILAS